MKIQKARKDHICDLCGEKIPKGDRYVREYEDDGIINVKEHLNCEDYTKNITADAPSEFITNDKG